MNAQFSPPAGTITRPVTAGGVPSLVVSPGVGHEPTVLYIHGGGYVIGSAFGYQPHAGALAAAAQTGILVPDYRLAPEHPFPAALEDAQRAYLWLREQTPDPDGIIVAGDSAGGGILLSLLLTLKREGLPLPRGRGDPLPVARPGPPYLLDRPTPRWPATKTSAAASRPI